MTDTEPIDEQAILNFSAGEGVEWEGWAREGALGFGRDRLQGITFDIEHLPLLIIAFA